MDIPKLNKLFSVEEANLIKSISLSSRQLKDKWYWKWESKGHFTVKSAYRSISWVEPGAYAQLARPLWRRLWNHQR